MEYNKPEALKFLQEELGYKPYPGKHYESMITRFYQAYILPEKFNIDKRKAHLSSLIVSGQTTRDEALKELEKPLFKSELEKENEIEFFCKKIAISRKEFFEIIQSKPKSHFEYKSYGGYQRTLGRLIKRYLK